MSLFWAFYRLLGCSFYYFCVLCRGMNGSNDHNFDRLSGSRLTFVLFQPFSGSNPNKPSRKFCSSKGIFSFCFVKSLPGWNCQLRRFKRGFNPWYTRVVPSKTERVFESPPTAEFKRPFVSEKQPRPRSRSNTEPFVSLPSV